ncbi:hypothetical protein [Streptomyces omiyaensis]|uniref:hypothetical protein n=1 Tax=Streptomyces omiyaensis TaxID=68247 RepID=UPI0036F76972
MTTEHEDRAAGLLIFRLVTRRGLTPIEAVLAVQLARAREAGPHADLVAAEVDHLLTTTTAQLRALVDALRPLAQTATRALTDLAQVLQQTTAIMQTDPSRRDRPAWVTPYGPPPRRRR